MDGASGDIDIQEMLQLQLSEVELLSSMYPNEGEMVLDDPMAVPELQDFVDAKIPYDNVQSRIGFTVKIQPGNEKVCLFFTDWKQFFLGQMLAYVYENK